MYFTVLGNEGQNLMEAFLPVFWQVDGLSRGINDPTQHQLDCIPRAVTLLEFL